MEDFLYKDITYKIRGAIFVVRKEFGNAFKEVIYQKALAKQFDVLKLKYIKEPSISIYFHQEKVGVYKPDFVVEDKVIIEIKVMPLLGPREERQLWYYLKGTDYKLALLVNFGAQKLQIRRWIYDKSREKYKKSA